MKKERNWQNLLSKIGKGLRVTVLAGSLFLGFQFNSSLEVHALSLPSGNTQIGEISGVPVIKAGTKDMSSAAFQKLVDAIVTDSNAQYVVNKTYWGGSAQLANGTPLANMSSGQSFWLKADGFTEADHYVHLNKNGQALIRSVGYATELRTGKQIPLDLGIIYRNSQTSNGSGTADTIYLAAKSQNGVITLGWVAPADAGSEDMGGSSESGSSASGSGAKASYVNNVEFAMVLVNANTGQPLPEDKTIMALKLSDIDVLQRATLGKSGAKGMILSPDTRLSIDGSGMVANGTEAVTDDTKYLSPFSYITIRQFNTARTQYAYTGSEWDKHCDMVIGAFGEYPFTINLKGKLAVEKETNEFGKMPWNSHYSFDPIQFDVIDQTGKVVDVLDLQADGRDTSIDLPKGVYTLREKSSNWAATGQTKHSDIKVTVEAGKTVKVPIKNTAVKGKIKISKSLDHGYNKTLPNKLYAFKGIQYKITSSDKKFTDTVTLDETGSGVSKELPLGTYDVQEIPNSVTSATGQVVNPKVYKVTLSYANETTKLVTSTSPVTNTPVLGEITITKTGVESGTEMWNSHYSLAGNEFKLTSKTDGKTYTIVTDEKGIAKKAELPLGKYLVEETKASPGFVNTFKPVEVELTYKNNTTEVVFGSAKGTNQEIKGENTLEKEDTETGKESQGKASMKNAEYQLFYDEDQPGKSPHKKGDFVKWSDIPKAKLLAGEKVTSSVINGKEVAHGDNVVINVDDEKLTVAVGNLALEKYVWREINAPEGYVLDKTEHRFELTKKDDKTQNIIAPTQVSKEQVIEAEVTIQKLVETQGETNESGYNGVEFTLTPLEGTKGEPIVVKTGVNPETNEDGFAQATLVYGDYVLKETKGVEGYDKIRDVYIHMETNEEKDLLTISASNQADFSKPFSKRIFSLSDNQTTDNPNGEESVGVVSTEKPVIRLSKLTFTNKDPLPPLIPQLEPKKDVTKTEGGESINHGDVALSSEFVYALKSSRLSNQRSEDLTEWTILDNYDERYDQYKHRFEVVATTNFGFGEIKKGNVLDKKYFIAEEKDGKVRFVATKAFLDLVNAHKDASIQVEIRARFFRHTSTDAVYNSFVETMNGEKIKSNEVDTKTPKPAPHKFTVVGEKVDLKGNKLLDDDDEMHDRYKETETDPYNDKTKNNEAFNFNTKMVKKGDELHYQLWLDTTPFDETSELSELQMVDDYDEKAVEPEVEQVKVYNAKGEDVTENFQAEVKEGKLTICANVFTKVTDSKEEETDIVDTEKIPFGQVYKLEFSAKVKPSIKNKADIRNVASQKIVDLEKMSNKWPTETRVNRVNTPAKPAPHKFVLSKKQFDLTGNKLLDDDSELKDRYGETNKEPYVDQVENNEKENINTQTVVPGQTLVYQLWLDTTSFDETNQLTALAMTDNYDAEAVSVDPKQVKVYDPKGKDVTKFFLVKDEKGKLVISANVFIEAENAKGESVKVIDTKKVSMGQIYKIDAPMQVKKGVKAGKDIVNTAKQESEDSEGTKLSQQTEKRVNHVPTPVEKVVKGVLPHTGETPSSRLVKVIGWLLLFGLAGTWKRNTILRKYRRIRRQLSK